MAIRERKAAERARGALAKERGASLRNQASTNYQLGYSLARDNNTPRAMREMASALELATLAESEGDADSVDIQQAARLGLAACRVDLHALEQTYQLKGLKQLKNVFPM